VIRGILGEQGHGDIVFMITNNKIGCNSVECNTKNIKTVILSIGKQKGGYKRGWEISLLLLSLHKQIADLVDLQACRLPT
jgi:hypothetical protein